MREHGVVLYELFDFRGSKEMDWSQFYAEDAARVTPYSLPHIIYLVVCVAIVVLVIKNDRWIEKNSRLCKKGALGIIIFQQAVLLYGWYAVMTGFDISVSLPLHICRVATLLTIVFLITENKKYMDVIFYFSIFALTSLFYPLDVYNFTHINGVSYMINHLMTVLIPIYGVIVYKWRPTWKGLSRAIICFSVYFVAVYIINPYIDGNYFYLVNRPFLNDWTYQQYGLLSYSVTVSGYALITALFEYSYSHAPKWKLAKH